MPLYQWRCSKCKTCIEVLRTFDQYEVPPGTDDDTNPPPCSSKKAGHKWARYISSPATIVKTWAWSRDGGKGSW